MWICVHEGKAKKKKTKVKQDSGSNFQEGSVCPSVLSSVQLTSRKSVWQPFCLSVRPFICLSVCLSVACLFEIK